VRLDRKQWLMLGLLVLGILVSTAYSQRPGGGKGGPPGGGGFNRGDWMFNILAGKDKDGKPNTEINVSALKSTDMWPDGDKTREKMLDYLKKKGVTSGMMSKDVYQGYNEEVGQPEQYKQFFDKNDTDKDGKLTKAEIEASSKGRGPSQLLERFAEFDKNKNGTIEFDEYLPYIKERMGGGRDSGKGRDEGRKEEPKSPTPAPPTTGGSADDKSGIRTAPVVKVPEPGLDSRPTVFRYGKLPTRDLPAWFLDLDKDKDGQVGLYEWRAGGKERSEFKKYDTNGDGFITCEELIAVQKYEDSRDTKDAKALTFARLNADPGSPDGVPPLPGSAVTKGDKGSYNKGDRGDKGGGGDMRAKMMEMYKGKQRGDRSDKDKVEGDKSEYKGKGKGKGNRP